VDHDLGDIQKGCRNLANGLYIHSGVIRTESGQFMSVKRNPAVFIFLLMASLALLAGCSDDQMDFSNQTDTPNTPQGTNAPVSLSMRSYSFTVTANQGFAQDFNSGYVVDFETPTTYTLHPAAQNGTQPPDQQGNYSYERRVGVIHLISSTPISGRVVDMAVAFTTPTTGSAHLTGALGETQDAIFMQVSP